MPLNQLSPIIIASKFVLLLVNESLISKLTDDRDLCEEFDDLVSKHHIKNIIFLVKQEMKEYWTGRVREFTPTQVFYWSETIDNYEKIIEELVARFVDLPSSQNQLAEKEREKIYGRIESIISLLASTEELLSLLQSEEISKFSIHFLDLDGHSVVNTYFFLFLNQFTINFLSTEDFFGEVSSNDLKDMMGQTFSVPLMEAFRHYEEILCCSGGDYGQLHINGSLLDYFELKIYGPHGTVRKEEETLSSFVSRLQSSSSTVEEYSHQNTPTRNMTASASTLKKLKYFLIKGIFLILYFELKLIYQAWEFLLFQVMVDIVPVQMVLETLTSCRVKDFQTEFWLVKAFSSERVRKNFLSQRYHPLKKEEKVSHLLKNNFESNQNSPENESRLFRELSQVYDNDEHHEKMYHLCGSIHRHRDRWINTHIIQATTITEKEKKLLICEFDKATKWIGYSINLTGSFMSSTFEIFKDFRELYKRKNILLKEWKQNIIVFIQTLFLSNLQDWIFPLLYLLVESIYCSQLLITHLTQLNLFQLPYHFEVCQQDESRLKLFQLPANNYEYHIEITELYQILIDSYSDFTAFHRQEDWVKLLHFPFSLGVDDNTADLKLIQKYLEKRGNSSLEHYAMEVLRISETTALIEKLSLIFHQETERFEITQYRLIGFEIKDFLFKISNNILIFNSVFMGDPTNFLKLCSNDFLEIHLTVRKYICSEVDYIFFIYLVWLSNLFLPNLNQENLSSLFQKDQVKDRVIFPFLFDKLSSHYVNQFYAVMEILAQRDSSLYTVKSDTQIPLLCVLVRFMNDVNSDFDEERRIYEFLNEIRIAIRSHTIFTRVRRNIRSEGAPKKRVNSQKSLKKSLEGTKREKEDLYDYSYLNNFEQFIDRVYRYFKRKYAKDTEIPETELKECLKKLYLYALNKDESTMNESFLINLHQTAFPSELHEFLGIARVEALRGLAVVIVVATLLQRHSFFQGSIMPNSSSTSGSNPHIYERNWILTVFTYWLAEYDPDHHIQDNPEEYGRLARFYHICTIVFNLFHTGRRLKRMYIFVGACIEGIPDEIFRVYSLGAERTELTKRREHIFMRITGLSPRKRGTKPKNSYLGEKFKRKRIGSSSFDEIQHGKTSTKTQHESSENEKEDDYDDDDDDDDDDDNEQITEQEFTLSSRDCYKYIPEWTD